MMRRALLAALPCLLLFGCKDKITGSTPVPQRVSPAAACNVQKTSAITLTGTGFSPLPTKTLTDTPQLVLPQLTLTPQQSLSGGAASGSSLVLPDDGTHVRWASQTQMSFDVYPDLKLGTGLYGITVKNGDGATGKLDAALLLVPPPKLTKLDDDLVCSDQAATLTLTGTGFIQGASALPTVQISGTSGAPVTIPAADLADCTALPGSSGLKTCTTLHFPLASGQLPVGSYTVKVVNPDPVGCQSSEPVTLTVVPPPSVAKVSSDLLCNADGAVPLTVTGANFLAVGSTQPTVTLKPASGTGTDVTATVDESTCTPVTGPINETARLCTQLTIQVPTTVAAGTYQVVVNDAPPAGCSSTEPVQVTLVPGPAIASLAPSEACDNSSSTSVTVTGTNFIALTPDGGAQELPTVAVGTQAPVTADSVSNCTAVTGPSAEAVQACTTLVFTVPHALATALGDGNYPVVIKNPAPADCVSPTPTCPAAQCLLIAPPPVVSGIAPTQICGNGGQLDIQGVGLANGTLTLASTSAGTVVAPVTLEPDGGAVAQVPSLSPGVYDATYQIAGGSCTAEADGGGTFSETINVVPGPQLFFADPRVVYSGITTQVTFYGASITGTVQSLQIEQQMGDGGFGAPVDLTNINYTPGANLVRADVPAGLPAGTYNVLLTDVTSCPAELPGGLVITNNLSVNIASITPPFGYKLADTAVTITGGAHGTFKPLPQAYLNPHNAGAGVVATPIRALALNEPSDPNKPDTLTGIVGPISASTPLTVGLYDLIVVNPDGTVGLLDSAFTVTDTPPPTITNVSPGSFPSGTNQQLNVTGSNFVSTEAFPDGGSGSIALTLNCQLAGVSVPTVTGSVSSVASGGGSLVGVANVPSSNEICVVRVTNPDGTYAEFSSVATTNASGNLSAFQAGPSMVTPRAALMAAAGNATSAARFLYAIGGNDGSGVLSSVESSPVDLYGTPSGFSAQPYALDEGTVDAGLPAPRERGTAVTVGRFIYLVGGTSDGGLPLNAIDRAEILDPKQSPQVSDLALDVDLKGGGLAPGVWYYRVAAVMAESDANNPGGETIAGDAFGLQLCNPNDATSPTYCPNLAGKALDVTLTWTAVADAVSYRIYRTASPDQTPDQTLLLAEIPATTTPLSYKDDGKTPVGTDRPHEIGALGRWSTVGTLGTGRIAPAVTSAADPGDATTVYLYAFGGLTAAGVAGDYEIVPVHLITDAFGREAQTVSTATPGLAHLQVKSGGSTVNGSAWLNLAYAATPDTAPLAVGSNTWIYVGPGATTAAATGNSGLFNYAELLAGQNGQLTIAGTGGARTNAFSTVATSLNNIGYGGTLEANWFYYFGGATSLAAQPSTAFTSEQLQTTSTLHAGGSNATALTPARLEIGTAVQSGTIYVLGGWSGIGPSAPTATTQYTNW